MAVLELDTRDGQQLQQWSSSDDKGYSYGCWIAWTSFITGIAGAFSSWWLWSKIKSFCKVRTEQRTVATQSQVTYSRKLQHPRFTVLPEATQGVFDGVKLED